MTTLTDLCDTALAYYRTGRARHEFPPARAVSDLAAALLDVRARYAQNHTLETGDAKTVAIALLIMKDYAQGKPLDTKLMADCLSYHGRAPMPCRPQGPRISYYCRRQNAECDYCRGDFFRSCRHCERRTG